MATGGWLDKCHSALGDRGALPARSALHCSGPRDDHRRSCRFCRGVSELAPQRAGDSSSFAERHRRVGDFYRRPRGRRSGARDITMRQTPSCRELSKTDSLSLPVSTTPWIQSTGEKSNNTKGKSLTSKITCGRVCLGSLTGIQKLSRETSKDFDVCSSFQDQSLRRFPMESGARGPHVMTA